MCGFVLRPFTRRRYPVAWGLLCKPCQQRQDNGAEDGKKDQFPDNVKQKRHGARFDEVAVCRSSIRVDYTADQVTLLP